jgi:hypothetical protein
MLTEPREARSRSSAYRLTAGKPARIRLTTSYEEDPFPLRTEGIYSVRGDVLTYCVAPPGRPRPAGFVTTKGDGNTLATLKRVPPELLWTAALGGAVP